MSLSVYPAAVVAAPVEVVWRNLPERHQLGLHVILPLGLQEKPHISCVPIDATTCRVQYG